MAKSRRIFLLNKHQLKRVDAVMAAFISNTGICTVKLDEEANENHDPDNNVPEFDFNFHVDDDSWEDVTSSGEIEFEKDTFSSRDGGASEQEESDYMNFHANYALDIFKKTAKQLGVSERMLRYNFPCDNICIWLKVPGDTVNLKLKLRINNPEWPHLTLSAYKPK
jgi:hypothetical protein